jgi:cardiolipin synthase
MSFLLLTTSEEVWKSVISDIQTAKKSIDVELFIINIDDVGLLLLNTLRQKSREGVKVRLLVDAGGSFALYLSNLTDDLKADGIHFSYFNHLQPWYPKSIRLWYFRNHRRSVVIDDDIIYIGGSCFSKNMESWRDSMIRLQGITEPLTDIREAFNRMWVLAEKFKFGKRNKPEVSEWTYLTNSPVPGRRYLYHKLTKLIQHAKKEIYLTTPYFIPDHRLMQALRRALKRGVHVHLLIPKHSNHPFVDCAGDFQKSELIKKGLKLYQYDKGMIHDKTAIFDNEYGIIGTMNLDHVSLLYNFENALITTNQECISELKNIFQQDIEGLALVTRTDWENRPFKTKLQAYIIWPLRKLL